jgi:para-aminobenzoate synthetase/4-amino-4-deoxychorismate lyase
MGILRRLSPEQCRLLPQTLAEFGSILLESQLRDRENRASYLLTSPVEVLVCHHPGQVADCLERAEELLAEGLALAGFLSYEVGQAGPAARIGAPAGRGDWAADPLGGFPLVWLGAYTHASVTRQPLPLPDGHPEGHPEGSGGPPRTRRRRFDLSRVDYCRAVRRALAYIAAGDNYQTNLTCRLHFDSPEEPFGAYLRLRRAQPVPYGAYLNCGGFQVVSQSPELFLRRRGDLLETRPMKGTLRRGLGSDEDARLVRLLRRDEKARAENIMIVDLMRNDLGRLARPGTVAVFDLFRVERYRTLLQMISGVRCRLRSGTSLPDILSATFPPGSVTGAPKHRTMQIIQELERSPRKLYTGAVGLFLPGGDMTLSVAIRTLIARGGHYEMGIGSGIVADSDAQAEWEETRLKSHFFFASAKEFSLLETMGHTATGGLQHLEEHLRRMAASARYFGYPFSRRRALAALEAPAGRSGGAYRVRLLLDRLGRFEAQWEPLAPLPAVATVVLSQVRTDPSEPLLYHKTTERALYDRELARARRLGFLEALFTNGEGLLTEGSFTSLMVKVAGRWVTPRLASGLLPGIWRAWFMRRHRARQEDVTPADLLRADEVLLGNSVRGAIRVERVVDPAGRVLFGLQDGTAD